MFRDKIREILELVLKAEEKNIYVAYNYGTNTKTLTIITKIKVFALYNKGHVRPNYMIFYNQDGETYEWSNGLTRSDWYTSNPQNKRMEDCFLYPKGIPEALKGTEYESVTNAFVEMARLGLMLNYNSLMAAGCRLHKLGTMMEYLAKGRFYRLCKETARSCWAYNGSYSGPLSVNGTSCCRSRRYTDI